MSFTYKQFSPVKFLAGGANPDVAFDDLANHPNQYIAACAADNWDQPINLTDITTFQLDYSALTGTDLVTDGVFAAACGVNWTCGAGWSIAAGVASYSGAGSGQMTQDISSASSVIDDLVYSVTFTISNMALNGGLGVVASIGGITFTTTAINGTFTYYRASSSYLNDNISFAASVGAETFDIDDVSVVLMSSIGIRIRDCADDSEIYVETDGTSVDYSITEATANITLDWSTYGLTVGNCYKVCVFDITGILVDLMQNGDFAAGAANWTLGSKWSVPGNSGVGDATPASSSNAQRSITNTLSADLQTDHFYTITFTVSNYTSGTVQVLTAGGAHGAAAGANGQFIVTIDMSGEADTDEVLFRLSDSTGKLDIDDITLFEQAASVDDDRCSECFSLGTDFSNTLLLQWTNDDDAFLFDYESFATPLVQYMRVPATLRRPQYPGEDKETYRDSQGNRDIIFSIVGKQYQLETEKLPEYIHDAIRVGLEHDTFKITGYTWQGVYYTEQEFTFEDNSYPLEWQEGALTSPVSIPLLLEIDLTNANC